MRKVVKYVAAATTTGLYGAAVLNVWKTPQTPKLPELKKVAITGAVMTGLVWVATLA
jgi:hypothetical protein